MYLFPSTEYLTPFIVALSCSLCACYPAMRVSCAIGAIDIPKDGRRMHTSSTPRAGGVAIFFAFALALLFYSKSEHSFAVVLSGGALMTALGLCDDVYPLPPRVKLTCQACISLIPLAFGFYAKSITFVGVTLPLSQPFGIFFSFFWIVGVVNAINLIDGLDGLSAGVSLVISVTMLVRFALVARNTAAAVLCASLSGALLGFLPYNAKNAKIFMGDCGSLSLGYTLAVITLVGADNTRSGGFPMLAIFLMLAYPLFDTFLAIARRIKNRTGIFSADRKHIHHRLCDAGLSRGQSSALLICVTAILCAISLYL